MWAGSNRVWRGRLQIQNILKHMDAPQMGAMSITLPLYGTCSITYNLSLLYFHLQLLIITGGGDTHHDNTGQTAQNVTRQKNNGFLITSNTLKAF